MSVGQSVYNGASNGATNNAAFAAITEDLRSRIIDWKGHPLSGPNGMGPLQLFDILSLRRESQVREFYVYLFREAIICVLEERKRALGRLLSSGTAASATDYGSISSGIGAGSAQGKGVLRLKGRIYIRHVRRVSDTSAASELSLTIDMEDERLDSFILIFKNRASLETWRATISSLVAQFQQTQGGRSVAMMDMDNDFGTASANGGGRRQEPTFPTGYAPNSKAQRILSGASSTDSAPDSLMGSGRSTALSSATSANPSGFHGGMGGAIPEETSVDLEVHSHNGYAHSSHSQGRSEYGSTPVPVPAGPPSNALEPLPHAPLDLILVISLPGPGNRGGSAELKLRVVRSSLDFVVANMGRRDRLSLVTFEVGAGTSGRVRKTPFLAVSRPNSRARLLRFIDSMGDDVGDGGPPDEFTVRGNKDEKTDVVTAVNHGLSTAF